MNQTKLEISVGVFVLLGLAAVAYLALKIGAGVLVGADTYVVNARFNNVSGLNAGARVAIAGVTVGSVDAVRLDTDNQRAIVEMRIRSDIQLPLDTFVSIKTNGLLGDKFLALKQGGDPENVAPDGMLTDTESALDLESLISRFAFGTVGNDPAAKEATAP